MRSLALSAALAVPLAGPALAQEAPPVYVQLDYMRVAEGAAAEYVALERDVFRPVHEERRRRGDLHGWSLYDMVLAEPGAPYDFVTVNVYTDPTQIDRTDRASKKARTSSVGYRIFLPSWTNGTCRVSRRCWRVRRLQPVRSWTSLPVR